MKVKITLIFLTCFLFEVSSQIAPFIDFNKFFKTFYKDNFRQLEFQQIRSFEGSDLYTVYIDFRGDFKLYDGENTQLITNQIIKYKLSDGQLAWAIANALYCYSNNKKELLTVFGNRFEVSDSLIIFEDTRFNTLNYRYQNTNHQLVQSTGDLQFPLKIGDNTVVYKDNGDFIKFLWRGQSFDYNVYTRAINFDAGMDVICFNDPINQSFTVFDKGEMLDLESMFVKKYKAARGFIVYEDIQGNLWHYQNGEKQQLSNFSANFWEAKDDLVIWEENSYIYTFYKGEKKQLLNYIPADYKIKNSTLVYRNSLGGISVFCQGKSEEITKQTQSSYEIYGNTVLVELFNKSFVVYHEGKKFEI
ncbi:MAG: hypothetical protein ACK5B9_05505 [Flavobacteriia bacterium]|jgi:hypothetical protein